MANIVDVDNAPGDLVALENSLKEAVTTQDSDKDVEDKTDDTKDTEDKITDPLAGTKFEGKSVEDILSSYKNLESAYGRMANDLGDQRKLTDRLLDLKRDEDLQRNAPELPKIEGAQLLDNPNETLDRYLSQRDERTRKEYDDRLAEMEAQMAQDRFLQKHPDFMTLGQDADFLSFAQATPTRSAIAQQAAAGDWTAADALLSEYKLESSKSAQQNLDLEDNNEGIEAAKQASLESAAQGGDSNSSGKVYRRADLIQLKIEKPDVYGDPAFQNEILKAYNEGRVK